MTDFKKQLLALLECEIPCLTDKIQAGAADARTAAPFAAFTYPEEIPIRTIHGIAGFRTLFEVSVYESKFAAAEQLKCRVIAALEGAEFDARRAYFQSASADYYADFDLHGITMTFKII